MFRRNAAYIRTWKCSWLSALISSSCCSAIWHPLHALHYPHLFSFHLLYRPTCYLPAIHCHLSRPFCAAQLISCRHAYIFRLFLASIRFACIAVPVAFLQLLNVQCSAHPTITVKSHPHPLLLRALPVYLAKILRWLKPGQLIWKYFSGACLYNRAYLCCFYQDEDALKFAMRVQLFTTSPQIIDFAGITNSGTCRCWICAYSPTLLITAPLILICFCCELGVQEMANDCTSPSLRKHDCLRIVATRSYTCTATPQKDGSSHNPSTTVFYVNLIASKGTSVPFSPPL